MQKSNLHVPILKKITAKYTLYQAIFIKIFFL